MQYVAIASSVMSAVGSIQQGKQQSTMYKLQSQQAQLKGSRDALQYEQQANQVLDRLRQTNATAAAKGFSGGVSGFSGSSKLVQEVNAKRAGADVQILQEGAKTAQTFGDIQSAMLTEAADQAITGSYFDAFAKIGTAAYMYNQTAPGTPVKKAPVVDRSINGIPA